MFQHDDMIVHCKKCDWQGLAKQCHGGKFSGGCPDCMHYHTVIVGPRTKDELFAHGILPLSPLMRIAWAFYILIGCQVRYSVRVKTEHEMGWTSDLEMEADLDWPTWFPRKRPVTLEAESGA